MIEKWDHRFLEMAEFVSRWSKDPSTKVGAVLVSPDRRTVFHGYNGFPSRMTDRSGLYNNREEKYQRIIHAEMNAILNATAPIRGFTLYTWPFLTCERCSVHVIQAGIDRVVAPIGIDPVREERWNDSLNKAIQFYTECDVRVDVFNVSDRFLTEPTSS